MKKLNIFKIISIENEKPEINTKTKTKNTEIPKFINFKFTKNLIDRMLSVSHSLL